MSGNDNIIINYYEIFPTFRDDNKRLLIVHVEQKCCIIKKKIGFSSVTYFDEFD